MSNSTQIRPYSMVKFKIDYDWIKKGTVAQFFGLDNDGDACIRFGKTMEYTHDLCGISDNYDGYFVCLREDNLDFNSVFEKTSVKRFYEKPKTKICCKCGKTISDKEFKTVGNKYLCLECAEIHSYYHKNEVEKNKRTKNNKTYGFEFECTCNEKNRNFITAQKNFGLIPCHDGSLPTGGVEFKSPKYNGLRGIRHVFKTLDSKVSFSNPACGQHINIGDRVWINRKNMSIIRDWKDDIFTELRVYLRTHPDDMKRVIGRGFGSYRRDSGDMMHGSWINLDHDNRIEFRLSKFKNPKQYFNLTVMWTKMLDAIINDFLKGDAEDSSYAGRSARAEKASKHLVKIFQSYC